LQWIAGAELPKRSERAKQTAPKKIFPKQLANKKKLPIFALGFTKAQTSDSKKDFKDIKQ
jgi:hypothetical protein